jgi:hypothetical protein
MSNATESQREILPTIREFSDFSAGFAEGWGDERRGEPMPDGERSAADWDGYRLGRARHVAPAPGAFLAALNAAVTEFADGNEEALTAWRNYESRLAAQRDEALRS